MKNKVLLPSAYSANLGRLAHISEKLSKSDNLRCPFCNEEVGFKKGRVRQHHFFHQKETNCNPSAESLLHEGAKAFLFSSLVNRKSIPINIVDLQHLPKSLEAILKSLGLVGISIPTSLLPGFSFSEHEIEKGISNHRPDILSKMHGSYFAWEIFVSHEIEEAKTEAFKKDSVPFIEIIPTLKESSEYYFALHSFGGFDLVDTQRAFFPLLFDNYREQLLSIYNSIT